MAEERTLGLARTREDFAEEPSKEELQRRLDETRDSISQTVTEIKETVANQVQAVKDTLDWKEQFKKRPVAWSAGAAGVGFLVGYCVAATVKGDDSNAEVLDYYAPRAKAYASQPVSAQAAQPAKENGNGHSFLDKLSHTPAYGRVKEEVGSVGDAFVQELGNTAKKVLLPALITSLTNFIGGHLRSRSTDTSSTKLNESTNSGIDSSSYQPQVGH